VDQRRANTPPGTHRPSAASLSTSAQPSTRTAGRAPPVRLGRFRRQAFRSHRVRACEAYTPVPQPPISSAPPPNPFPLPSTASPSPTPLLAASSCPPLPAPTLSLLTAAPPKAPLPAQLMSARGAPSRS